MNELFRYLQELVKKNGPTKEDYPALNSWIDQIIEAKQSGRINEQDLADLRELWGDALSLDTCQGFGYRKPHGYAGDFEMLDRLYTRFRSPKPTLANWDRFSHQHAAVLAVRNRPRYIGKIVLSHLKKKSTISVLNIVSGPGRDMHYFFSRAHLNGSKRVSFDCLEQDPVAIAYARAVCRDYLSNITFMHGNIFKRALTKKYDIIWASGLFDYFSDRMFKRILQKLLPHLKKDGECVIGNFSNQNRAGNYLELMEWHLHYRSPDELRQLALASGVKKENISIKNEKTGVNLFLHIRNK